MRLRALLALLCACAHGFFEKGSDVVTLASTADWKQHVTNSSFLWIVAFYREGCGYCVLLEPEFASAATQLKRLVKFGAVDVEKHRRVADAVSRKHEFRIEGVPTLKAFSPTAAASPFDVDAERTARDARVMEAEGRAKVSPSAATWRP